MGDNFWSYLKADVLQVGAVALAASSILSGFKSAENFCHWRSLKSAFLLNESTIDALRTQPKKRLHVKLNGVLTADTLIPTRNSEGEAVQLVCKQDWHGYTSGWTEALRVFVSSPAYGFNPQIVLSPSAAKLDHPRVKVSRRALSQAKGAQLFNSEHKTIANRIFATFYSLYLFNYPFEYTHRTYGLRNGSYMFASMDAVLDDNGDITLCPSQSFMNASLLTTDHEERVSEHKFTNSWRYAAASVSLFVATTVVQHLALKAREEKGAL